MNQDKIEDIRQKQKLRVFYELTRSEGWSAARRLLEDHVIDIQSVRNITTDSPEQVIIDIKSRNQCVDTMLAWIKQIEDRAEQYTETIDEKIEEQGYVRKY